MGSVVVPPWIQRLCCSERWTWAAVSVTVTAPAMFWPVGTPWALSRGVLAWVVGGSASGLETIESFPNDPETWPAMPLPKVNCHPVIGVQAGWTAASTVGSTVWSPEYGVSGPRSWRLSMMLLRARLAVTEAYVGQLRAASVTW